MEKTERIKPLPLEQIAPFRGAVRNLQTHCYPDSPAMENFREAVKVTLPAAVDRMQKAGC